MFDFRRAVFAVTFAWFLQRGLFLDPCSEIFIYQRNGSKYTSGILAFENDLSGIYNLELKIASHFNDRLKVTIWTSNEDVQNGKSIAYEVQFPKKQRSESTIPTPISVTFNEKLYCNDTVPNGTISVQNLIDRHSFNLTLKSHGDLAINGTEFTKSPWQPSFPTSDSSECGIKRDYSLLVLGGQLTKEGEYPWLVALFYFEKYRCAGTLISNKHVITASHCVFGDIDKKKLFSVLGRYNIENWIAESTFRKTEKIIVHPDYFNVSYADIAIIIFDAPVAFDALIRPICLWDEAIDLTNVIGEKGTVAGWGEDGSGTVTEARQINMPIVEEITCLRSNLHFHSLTSNRTFCAGARDGRIPCRGDSGSGFVMKRGGRWKLRGVVSSALIDAKGSCDGNHYAVFSDIAKYNAWLTSILSEGLAIKVIQKNTSPSPAPTMTTTYKSSTTSTIRPRPRVEDGMKVICHFRSQAFYLFHSGKFLPEDIDEELCTHITYDFAILDETSLTLKPQDITVDIDNEIYKKILSYQSKGIIVLIALGGWTDSIGDKYSRLVNDAAARARFIAHVTDFFEEWQFDGLNIEWQYPRCWRVDCSKGPDSDKPAFAQFLKELHEAFAPRGLLLSATVGNGKTLIDLAYDVPALNKYLDWIAVMCYDYHGPWDNKTGHVAPFYYYPGDSYEALNTNYTLNYWIKLGVQRKKLIMGVPHFGASFTLADSNNNRLHAKSNGPGLPGEFTTKNGSLAFYEICIKVKYQRWNVVRDPEERIGPYAYKGNQWVSYDDIAEIRRKSQYVKANGLGGGMIYALDLDDFRNICGCGRYPLLTMMNHELRGVPLEGNLENCT